MKRLIFIILICFCFVSATGQAIQDRSSSVVTVQDGRLAAKLNFFLPRFSDTTSANLSKGIDSCGALIFTYDSNKVWYRQCSPKKWVIIGADGSSNAWQLFGNTLTNPLAFIGTINAYDLNFGTNNLKRLSIKSDGIQAAAGTVKPLGIDSVTGYLSYSNGGTNFNPIAGTNMILTGTYPNITFNAQDTSIFNVVINGADPTGINPSSWVFNLGVASGKPIYVPPGRYRIDTAINILNSGQKIFGAGNRSVLFTTTIGSTSTLLTAFNFLQLSTNCTVDNLRFEGTGKTTYSFPWTTQNGIWVQNSSNLITNCSFYKLRGTAILGVRNDLANFIENNVFNCYIAQCTVGLFNYVGSEYWDCSSVTIDSCNIGVNERGANNTISNSHIDYNDIAMMIYNNGGNSDHSSLNNSTVNHNLQAFDVYNLAIGYTVNNCSLFFGWAKINESDKMLFNGGAMALDSLVVTATSTIKTTSVNNMYVYNSTNFRTTGTAILLKTGLIYPNSTTTYTVYDTITTKNAYLTSLPTGSGSDSLLVINGGLVKKILPSSLTVNNIYTADGTLAGTRTITNAGFNTIWSGTGKFGIGGSPLYKLDVQENASSVFAASITNNSSTGGGLGVNTFGTGALAAFQVLSGTGGATSRFIVNNNGKVAVGPTTNPDSLLQVQGGIHTWRIKADSLSSGSSTDSVVTVDANGTFHKTNLTFTFTNPRTGDTLLVPLSSNSARIKSFLWTGLGFTAATTTDSTIKPNLDSAAIHTWVTSWTGSGSGMAIGGTVTSGTAKSSLFIDASGKLAQDNANYFWDYTQKSLNIGPATSSNGVLNLKASTATNTNFSVTDGSGTRTWGVAATTAGDFAIYGGAATQLTIKGTAADHALWLDATGLRINGTVANSSLDVNGSFGGALTTQTTTYTATVNDYTIICNNTGGAMTVNLPAAAGCTNRIYVIKKISTVGNDVTIDPNASETIDGSTTATLTLQYTSLMIQSDGTQWWIL